MALPPESKTELNFQPITEGLGFHPFSDGLPYAPIGKTQTKSTPATARPTSASMNMGAGAVAAGRPTFVPARPQSPRVSVPVARQAQQQQALHTPALPQQKPQTTQPIQNAALAAELEPRFGFGYLFKRVFAFALDTCFNVGLCAGALSLALWKQHLSPQLLLTPGVVFIAVLFLAAFNWAITTAQEVAFGTSVGKRVFGLSLNGEATAIFLRSFFFLPSLCFGAIGILWSVVDRRKRCWHDLVVDLQPTEIARL